MPEYPDVSDTLDLSSNASRTERDIGLTNSVATGWPAFHGIPDSSRSRIALGTIAGVRSGTASRRGSVRPDEK